MNYAGRQAKLQQLLSENRLQGLLVTHLPNVRYLCGFTGSAGALLLTEKKSVFFSDGRYKAQSAAEVKGARIAISRKSPLVTVAEWLAAHPAALGKTPRLGVENSRLSFHDHQRLAASLPGVRLRSAPSLVEKARMIKDADEIKLVRDAARLGSSLFDTVLGAIRPGVRETQVAAEMEYAARRAGADSMSFDTIIAAGPRAALPHGRASVAPIPRSGFVVCDFGVILAGYCSDMTRTVHVGAAGKAARQAYTAVKEAQQAALEAVKPGTTVGEVDRAARKLLQKQGLGQYFTHSTGHGVGLEIHEPPRLAAGQDEILKPGMVVTVEPGVYLPGKWGIRIEDMALVTDRGCEILTAASKELLTV